MSYFPVITIQRRLMLGFAVVIVLPAVLLTAYNIIQMRGDLIERTKVDQRTLFNSKVNAAESFLRGRHNDLLLLGQAPQIRRMINATEEDAVALLPEVESLQRSFLLRRGGDIIGIRLLDRIGQERVALSLHGTIIENITQEGVFYRDQEYFTQALQVISIPGREAPIYFAQEIGTDAQGSRFIRASMPLIDDHGRLAGVLVAKVAIDPLMSALLRDLPEGGRAFLVETQGDVVSSYSRREMLPGPSPTLQSLRPQDWQVLLGQHQTVLFGSKDFPDRLTVATRLRSPGQGSLRLTAILDKPLDPFLAPLYQAQRVVLGTTLLTLVVAAVLAWLITRSITRPLDRLVGAASGLGDGNWELQLPDQQRRDEIGTLARALAMMTREISESYIQLQDHRDQLDRQRSQLRAILDNSPTAVFAQDGQGHFLFVNRSFEEMCLCQSEHIVGQHPYDCFSDTQRQRFAPLDGVLGDQDSALTIEHSVSTGERQHTYLSTVVPLRDSQGMRFGICGVSSDISDRKRAEEVLARSHAELECLVQERTKDLEFAHQQIVEVARQAGMAEIATNVLHNVGNALNSIAISLDVIDDTVKDMRVDAIARIVRLVQQDGLGNTSQLVAYTQAFAQHLEQSQQTLLDEQLSLRRHLEHIRTIVATQQSYAGVDSFCEAVDPQRLIEDALRIAHVSQHGKPAIQVSCDLDPGPPIQMDKHRVLQILVNLFSNARHALMESGCKHPTLKIRLQRDPDHYTISVTDNGIGIAPENQVRIFNFGFTTRHDGHGFGLHGSALAAQQMQGQLRLHSDGPGLGSTFTLTLPWNVT